MKIMTAVKTGVLCMVLLFSLPVSAQYVNPCTDEQEFWTEEWLPDGTMRVTFIEYVRDFSPDTPFEEVEEWCAQIVGLVGAQCQGSGGVINPIGLQNQTIFTNMVFTDKVIPIAAGTIENKKNNVTKTEIPTGKTVETESVDEESGKAVMLEVSPDEDKPTTDVTLSKNNLSSDFEYDIFNHTGNTGNNFLLRAGYAHTSDNGEFTYGGNFIFNTLLMMEQTFFNNSLNLFGTKVLKETSKHDRKVGATINAILIDKDFGPYRFGASLSAHLVNRRYLKKRHVIAYGYMLQQSFVGSAITSLLSAGVTYGLPLGDRLALNTDVLYTLNALSFGKDGYVKMKNPNMLSLAENVDIFFTRTFSLTLGAKTTLLVKDYNDFIITIGASRRF